jgi:predicted molibdopterin-dependent oxidoreductase YjgC
VGEARPEWEIPCQLVTRAFPQLCNTLSYEDSSDIRAEMGRTMPVYSGIENLSEAGDWIQWGGPQLCADGNFSNMPDGKARFNALEIPDVSVPEGQFYLTTRRGKQFNSIRIKDMDQLQGGLGRDDLFMASEDMDRLALKPGGAIEVRSEHGEWHARARPMPIMKGVVQAYWPECNPVIGMRIDPNSEEPDYNALVTIEKARP